MRELFKAMIEADKELPRSMVIAQLKMATFGRAGGAHRSSSER